MEVDLHASTCDLCLEQRRTRTIHACWRCGRQVCLWCSVFCITCDKNVCCSCSNRSPLPTFQVHNHVRQPFQCYSCRTPSFELTRKESQITQSTNTTNTINTTNRSLWMISVSNGKPNRSLRLNKKDQVCIRSSGSEENDFFPFGAQKDPPDLQDVHVQIPQQHLRTSPSSSMLTRTQTLPTPPLSSSSSLLQAIPLLGKHPVMCTPTSSSLSKKGGKPKNR
mmetsp:Transcript_28644/g.73133  ORF Transcript_28644/g.73133 Transcript_28644/m.73133 type:complete len:222 (+) Transcript_28644:2377-3042(+)